jgi:hypothetical protein
MILPKFATGEEDIRQIIPPVFGTIPVDRVMCLLKVGSKVTAYSYTEF